MKKRPLGQNFLTDHNIAREIVRLADITSEDHVLEIGPGKGILTDYLLQSARQVDAVEIDPKLCAQLTKRYRTKDNFRLLETNALTLDYSAIGSRFKVVANLPYYVATPILKRLIGYHDRIIDMTLMMQKEVAHRLLAHPGQKEYGSLSVFVQYHCEVQPLLEVDKTRFSPSPKVDSTVVKVVPLSAPRVKVQNPQTFFKIVHAAFFHKRKMLKNNFKVWEKQFRREQDGIHLAGIDLTRRGETLTLEDFATIANYLNSHHA